MSAIKWKEECKKYEIIALSFMTKETNYIDRFLVHGPIKSMMQFFSDENCQYIFKQVYSYYIKFKEILIMDTFESLVDNACLAKEIDSARRVQLLELFEEILDEQKNWKAEQYNQFKHEWFQAEIAPKFSDLLREEKARLDSCKTFQVFANLKKMMNRYESLTKADEGLRVVFLNDYMPILKREFNEARLKGNTDEGVLSGIKSIDTHLVNGFGKGKLSLIGGRASSGKTTLAVNIATNMMRAGKKVIFVSLEMSEKELSHYMISRIAKIPYKRLADPNVNNDKYSELINLVHDKIRHDFCILKGNAGVYTWEEIEAMIEHEIVTQGFYPDAIIVDYLALIALPKDGQRRDIQLGDLAKKMRTFAEKTHTAVITLVQANRQSVTKDPKTGKDIVDIKLENIEDSNKVGQDADMFLTINQSVQGDNSVKYDIWIKKQRGGKREVLIELDSDMRYYWIMDQEGMFKEPYALGENPTKEERELYTEVTRIEKKDSSKIETGIDEDDTAVSEDDFETKTGDTTGVSEKVEKVITSSSYREDEYEGAPASGSVGSMTMDDLLGTMDKSIQKDEEKAKVEEPVEYKVDKDLFGPEVEDFGKTGYESYE